MKLSRNLILLLIVVLVAGVALVAIGLVTSRTAQRVRVVAATVDIPKGKVLSAEMLGSVEVRKPDQGETVYYVYDPQQVIGQQTLQDYIVGQALDSRTIGTVPPPGWAFPSGEVVPPNDRGLAIPVDQRLAVGGTVKSGALVTIYYAKDVDWEAVQTYLDNVAKLKPAGSVEATGGVAPAQPGGTATGEEAFAPQILFTMDTLPYKYEVLYQHVRVLDLRQGPTGGGVSQVLGEARAGTNGAVFLILDVTDEQAKVILYYLRLNRLDFAIEGEGGEPQQ